MSTSPAPNAGFYAELIRKQIAEAKAKFHAAEQEPDDDQEHAQAARNALREGAENG